MKDTYPKISVLMPSLNVAKYIDKCLASVVNQTFKDLEIICIDAGSTDGTLEKIKTFAEKDKRIKIIYSDKKSYGYQMNLGVKAAKGEYIGIVETDDYISENMYSDLFSIASEKNADVAKANYFEICADSTRIKEIYLDYKYEEIISKREIKGLIITTPAIWSGIYKKDFLLNNNIFFLESPGASYQDTGFIIKVFCCEPRIVLIKRPFYYYRTDNENSSVKSHDKVFCICDEFQEVERFIGAEAELPAEIIQALAKRKILAYLWNYNRLSGELQEQFLKRIQSEFIEIKKKKLIYPDYLDDYLQEFYLAIQSVPLAYHCYHNGITSKTDLPQLLKYKIIRDKIRLGRKVKIVLEKIKKYGLVSTSWYYCKKLLRINT